MTEQDEIKAKTIINRYYKAVNFPKEGTNLTPLMEEIMLVEVYNTLDSIFGDESVV